MNKNAMKIITAAALAAALTAISLISGPVRAQSGECGILDGPLCSQRLRCTILDPMGGCQSWEIYNIYYP